MAKQNAFRRPASRGAKSKYLWTSALILNSTITSGVTETDIVAPADWERGATSFERATLVAIRGWLSVFPIAAGSETIFMYIGLYDQDEGGSLADIVATYQTEDILWTGGHGQFAAQSTLPPRAFDINVKANRKITSASEVRLVRTGNAGSQFQVSGVLRGLIRYT